jgi:hypothetical protein
MDYLRSVLQEGCGFNSESRHIISDPAPAREYPGKA